MEKTEKHVSNLPAIGHRHAYSTVPLFARKSDTEFKWKSAFALFINKVFNSSVFALFIKKIFNSSAFALFLKSMMWLLGLWLCSMMVKGELVENLSFQKPFELISSDGDRKVSKDWQHGGTTVVNSHFIRLTIDRQSKRGWIWNTNKINMEEFSIIFTFRISGSSEKLFGDGVGLWITNVPSYTEGDLHAFSRKYTGVGIIFDTFYNTENKGGHKDVTVLVNNGQKGGVDMLQDETVLGCDIPSLRYYEKSAKFNPSKSMSRAKVQYKLGKLTVKVDASNSGTWTDCYTTNVQLPKGWTNAATLGVTASTGTLADNHDVIGLAMFKYGSVFFSCVCFFIGCV